MNQVPFYVCLVLELSIHEQLFHKYLQNSCFVHIGANSHMPRQNCDKTVLFGEKKKIYKKKNDSISRLRFLFFLLYYQRALEDKHHPTEIY